jgi:hypothetical protein
MSELAIDAGMASPAPDDVPTAHRGISTSVKTTCLRHCHIYSSGLLGPSKQVWLRSW